MIYVHQRPRRHTVGDDAIVETRKIKSFRANDVVKNIKFRKKVKCIYIIMTVPTTARLTGRNL